MWKGSLDRLLRRSICVDKDSPNAGDVFRLAPASISFVDGHENACALCRQRRQRLKMLVKATMQNLRKTCRFPVTIVIEALEREFLRGRIKGGQEFRSLGFVRRYWWRFASHMLSLGCLPETTLWCMMKMSLQAVFDHARAVPRCGTYGV